MAQESSFDVVSHVDLMEVSNAVQQAQKEIAQRFDFKGTAAKIETEGKDALVLAADDENQLVRVYDVLAEKLARRKVPLKALERAAVEPAAKGTVRQRIKIVSGLESEMAKDVANQIQLYYAENGRGYTATATTPSTQFERFELQFRQLLGGLALEV